MKALLVMLAACGGATSDPGYGTPLEVSRAQFRPGAFPDPSGGPDTHMFVPSHATVTIGTFRETLHGVLAESATSAIIGLAGEDGAWIVVAGPPSFETPDQPSIDATFGLGDSVTPGPQTLLMAGVDGDGRIGTSMSYDIVADIDPAPAGDLVVHLVWDSAADLDLHVVDPNGNEAWSAKPSTAPQAKPGEPQDPFAVDESGSLDHDGNAECHRDGSPNEAIIWTTREMHAPVIPAGTYTVRVDTREMCGDASAAWYVEVLSEGSLIGSARGVSVPDDVRGTHSYGAGVTALTFTQ
ncbi:MAG: hypothetical protein QM831_07005 [Kofleriaceae bacterium]